MSEAFFLVCPIPAEARPVTGAYRSRCHDCGSVVCVAPSSAAVLAKGAIIVCHFCARRRMEACPEQEKVKIENAWEVQ